MSSIAHDGLVHRSGGFEVRIVRYVGAFCWRSVTLLPRVHFEKHPPQSSAPYGSSSGALIARTRDPESSAGTNSAEHAAHG